VDRLTLPGVEEYLAGLFAHGDPVLIEMEQLGRSRGFPIVGPLVGGLLEILARSIRAQKVLELGSGFGYSAYWFARGIVRPGRMTLTDAKEENLQEARDFLRRGGFTHQLEYFHGDALDRLDRDGEVWDIVFCDIDKTGYPAVIDRAVERVRPGGLLIFDNMLWSGRVLPESGSTDEETRAIREANRKLSSHPDLRTSIIPLRDGVAVAARV
jgi:predicted O-methyltransferase YrrM